MGTHTASHVQLSFFQAPLTLTAQSRGRRGITMCTKTTAVMELPFPTNASSALSLKRALGLANGCGPSVHVLFPSIQTAEPADSSLAKRRRRSPTVASAPSAGRESASTGTLLWVGDTAAPATSCGSGDSLAPSRGTPEAVSVAITATAGTPPAFLGKAPRNLLAPAYKRQPSARAVDSKAVSSSASALLAACAQASLAEDISGAGAAHVPVARTVPRTSIAQSTATNTTTPTAQPHYRKKQHTTPPRSSEEEERRNSAHYTSSTTPPKESAVTRTWVWANGTKDALGTNVAAQPAPDQTTTKPEFVTRTPARSQQAIDAQCVAKETATQPMSAKSQRAADQLNALFGAALFAKPLRYSKLETSACVDALDEPAFRYPTPLVNAGAHCDWMIAELRQSVIDSGIARLHYADLRIRIRIRIRTPHAPF